MQVDVAFDVAGGGLGGAKERPCGCGDRNIKCKLNQRSGQGFTNSIKKDRTEVVVGFRPLQVESKGDYGSEGGGGWERREGRRNND